MSWDLPFLISRLKDDIAAERRDQIIIETIIALHRFRGEAFQDNRSFYIIKNPEDHEEVCIGFVETGLQENIFKIMEPETERVSDRITDIVRKVLES